MKKLIKNNIKLVLVFILGLVISGVGVYALTVTADQISYDNTQSGIQADNVSDAIDKLYEKAENNDECPSGYTKVSVTYGYKCVTNTSTIQECSTGYTKTVVDDYSFTCSRPKPICKRATTLHTETCANTTNASYYCRGDGYSSNGTITYGKRGTNGVLKSGDAFDCDVNGDGTYNSTNERFYYVSDYYDTSTKSFDSNYASLIYYSNTSSGSPGTGSTAWYSSNTTSNGPATAKANLPTTSQWSNVSLKTTSRKILMGTDPTSATSTILTFSYSGYAARMLTIQELKSACPNATTTTGSMSNCQYFFERTRYSTNNITYGHWLETAYGTSAAWSISSPDRYLDYRNNPSTAGSYTISTSSYYGTRPVIDVPKTKMEY